MAENFHALQLRSRLGVSLSPSTPGLDLSFNSEHEASFDVVGFGELFGGHSRLEGPFESIS